MYIYINIFDANLVQRVFIRNYEKDWDIQSDLKMGANQRFDIMVCNGDQSLMKKLFTHKVKYAFKNNEGGKEEKVWRKFIERRGRRMRSCY